MLHPIRRQGAQTVQVPPTMHKSRSGAFAKDAPDAQGREFDDGHPDSPGSGVCAGHDVGRTPGASFASPAQWELHIDGCMSQSCTAPVTEAVRVATRKVRLASCGDSVHVASTRCSQRPWHQGLWKPPRLMPSNAAARGPAVPTAAPSSLAPTPHIGGSTRETLIARAPMIAGEIACFAVVEPLVHSVNGAAVKG
jgi:hypothetical protein